MKTISILIPSYNEEAVLPQLYDRLVGLAAGHGEYNFEFFFVDDGSKDRTMEIISELAQKDTRISYVSLSRNFGKEIAMVAGFDYVLGDAVVIIDADLQDPPELISEMIALWEQGYDDIYARRRSRKGETWTKRTTSRLYYQMLRRTTRIDIQEDTGDFRLLDRRVVDALALFRESERNTKAIFSWVGFRKKEVLYDRDPRAAGKTHWSYSQLINLAIEGITSFTTAPLRISTVAGVIVSLFSFLYLLFLVVRTVFFGSDVSGYPSMMAVILFLGGIQLIFLGIIGEYVGRIFNETKRRPLYLVEKIHSSDIGIKARRENRD